MNAEIVHARDLLKGHQFRFMHETDLYQGIAEVLTAGGIEFEREFRLTSRDRLDFWLPASGTAIEVKVRDSLASALRQVDRYLKDDRVKGVLLAGARAWALRPAPPVSVGKTFAMVYLRRPIA